MFTVDELVQFAKNTGYIYQGSEIYGGLANTWDYGPLGSLLKINIKKAWLQKFQRERIDNVLLDGSILLNNKVWEASGHVAGFSDPLIECKKCNQRYRVDKLIYDHDKTESDGWFLSKFEAYILKNRIKCPNCGAFDWTEIRAFNMMFQTYQGAVLDKANQIYLRPENAQNVFVQYKNVLRSSRKKIPFGICHVGKAFRNEITPGNFIFRTREFEQMELEYFVKPGTEIKWFEYWKQFAMNWLIDLGISKENLRFDDHKPEALSHYSNATTDIQYRYPWGFDEVWGIASRTDFDLRSHQEHSGESMEYLDPETNEKYIPYCVEPSVGVERLVFAFLSESLITETLEDGSTRDVLKLHPFLAPYKVAVLPLSRRDLSEKAEAVYHELAKHFDTVYDESQSIGRRYRRQDQIGTPFAVTIDYDTLEDNTVTVRDRDTMEQVRLPINEVAEYIKERIRF
ncbi:MAG: glycine--tRNA ligase [Acholeplasmataceae bacterium]|jgi:glycyl-tRNA synthetase